VAESNKLWDDFRTKDILDGISADNFDSMKDKAFIVPENLQFFKDLLIVGWLSGQLSSSGPIPNTAQIVQVSSTSNGVHNFFIPPAGEVWQITGCSNGAKDATTVVVLTDGVDTVELGQESAANTAYDPFGSTPIYIDSNVWLAVSYTSTGGGTTEVDASFIRVR